MNEAKATKYQRLRRQATLWAWSFAGGALVAIAVSPASRALERWARGVTDSLPAPASSIAALIAFTLVVVLVFELAALPALLYRVLRVDRALGHATATTASLAAELPAAAMALPLATGVGALVQMSAAASADWWWLYSALGLSAGLVVALGVGPLLLGSFGALRPISGGGLAMALAPVVERARVPVNRIYEWQVDSGANASALVTGVGRGRRVLVSSELVRTWPQDEVVVVVAHELAHHVHHDLWRARAFDACIIGLGLWGANRVLLAVGPAMGIGSAGALSALPLIAVVTGGVWLLSTPFRHAQSRRQELRADAFALACTGAADAFGRAVRRLSVTRLSEERPSTMTRWLFHRHPPVAERLAVAEAYRRGAA